MPSIVEIVPQDFPKPATITFNTPHGREDVHVVFYPNRLTSEPFEDGDEDDSQARDDPGKTSLRNAEQFVYSIKEWDVTGPLKSRKGVEVVDENTIIPLEPEIVRLLPAAFTNRITDELRMIINPPR